MKKEYKLARNRAYEFCDEQQQALDDGLITEEEWYAIHEETFTAHYLASDNPRGQSGHSGGETVYRYTRGMIAEAISKSGSYIDVGCANGHLIEMVDRWLGCTEVKVICHGLDISEGLIRLAKKRMPHWSERFYLGNALHWMPGEKFDYVYAAELGYVPRERERELMDHLYNDFVSQGGRLILGPHTEERGDKELEEKVRGWGYVPTGYCEKSHITYQELCKRMLWFDKPEAP